jgi:hypothetical protein
MGEWKENNTTKVRLTAITITIEETMARNKEAVKNGKKNTKKQR